MAKLFSYKIFKFKKFINFNNYTVWSHNIYNIIADKKNLGYLDRIYN